VSRLLISVCLSGDSFFFSMRKTDPDFTKRVRSGRFCGSHVNHPLAKGKTLYIKLRDDPSAIDTATVLC